jgi:DDE superfamily endonuclease
MDSLEDQARVEAVAVLSRFRRGFYDSLTRRADALFELTDALLCADGPVASLAELSVELVHRRGHGAMYDALVAGRIDAARLRRALTGLDLPRGADRQLTIAIDVTPWPRPDAECSPGRLHCHRPCRCDGVRQTIPGWPYQVAVALAGGRSSWTWPLDVVRLGPDDDLTAVTAAQIRALVARLTQAGQWRPDDPPILFVVDAGYDVVRLSWLLGEVPVRLLGRVRADRVVYGPAGRRRGDHPGRPPRHGAVFRLGDPVTHPVPAQASTSTHDRFGKAVARCWGWLHPKLERRSSWADHKGQLPIVEGTLVHLGVERLPGDRDPKPLWLWYSHPDAAAVDVDRLWRIFLRRFDVEHTFRLFKQTLGLTRPRLRSPEQADRWAWLIAVAYTQLRLARPLAGDLRRPWERPLTPDRLTPCRVRRGYRRIRRVLGTPASAPKPSRPGPGRPKGRTSAPAPRYPVGKKQPKADMPQASKTTDKG